jgi:glycosyltransferase involved in cell wall biosynthesis
MKTLSLHMIARNSADVIERTLQAASQVCDEIVVVDTGSTDFTKDICAKYGAKVYDFEWVDDFAAARNYALSKVTGDWAMWLDTGDEIKAPTLKAIADLKKMPIFQSSDPSSADVIWMTINRKLNADGSPMFSFVVPRIVRMSANPFWVGAIHENVRVDTTDTKQGFLLEGASIEDPYSDLEGGAKRNLAILERLIASGDPNPRLLYYRSQELRDLQRLQEAIDSYVEFLNLNPQTWEYYDALINIGKCYYNRNDVERKDRLNAAGVWMQAALHEPRKPDAWFGVGTLYYEAGELEKALPFYRACIGLKKIYDGAPTNEAMYGSAPYEAIGFCLLTMGNTKEAIASLFEAQKRSPRPDHYRNIIRQIKEQVKTAKVAKQ